MNLFRLAFVIPLAAIVTLGLFYMMSGFISNDGPVLVDPSDSVRPVITAQIVDTEPTPIPKPDSTLPKDPPPLTKMKFPKIVDPTGIPIDNTPPTVVDLGVREIGGNSYSGPLVRPTPPYPQKCLARGTEGRVLVQFDVTPEGNVVNVRIIESPDACFNRSVLKAVSGWKYSPATDSNGKAITRHNVVEAVSFEIEE